jgi:hypothetical protein
MGHSCQQRHAISAYCVLTFVATCFLFVPAVSAQGGTPATPLSLANMEQWVAAAGKVNPPKEESSPC